MLRPAYIECKAGKYSYILVYAYLVLEIYWWDWNNQSIKDLRKVECHDFSML